MEELKDRLTNQSFVVMATGLTNVDQASSTCAINAMVFTDRVELQVLACTVHSDY